MDNLLSESWLPWAVAVAVGLPLAVIMLGEVIERLERLGSPMAAPLRLTRNLLLPLVALIVLLEQVGGLDAEGLPSRLLETGLWLLTIVVALGLVNALVFSGANDTSWRARLPRIFLDLGRLVLILIGALILLSTVWGADVSGLVTALGISSIVIGLALQNSVGNIIAGLLLLFERPFALGDWLKVGDSIGKVVEINWRATHLDIGNAMLVVPNGTLSTVEFVNFDRPDRLHLVEVALRFSLNDPPTVVKRTLLEVARGLTLRAPDSEPEVLVNVEGALLTYTTAFTADSYTQSLLARDEFITRVWYASRRAGLALHGRALPPATLDPAEALARTPPFVRLSPEGLAQFAARARTLPYAAGEVLLSQGERSPGLFVMVSGAAELATLDGQRGRLVIERLDPGEFFGEELLTREPLIGTVTALVDCEALLIEAEAALELLDAQPQLTREIGQVSDLRRQLLQAQRGAARPRRAAPIGQA